MLYPRYAHSKISSAGKAYPYTEVKLVDDDFKTVPRGARGEFAIRSTAVFTGYLNDPENTAAALRDGWVLTGDIGVEDEDGFLYLVDHKKDIIIRGGHNIGSTEVESVIYGYPGIVEAAAVGVPHPKLGEDVFAFVVTAANQLLDKEGHLAHCRENLSDYKVPRHIVQISAFPRNPMGKILKTKPRKMALEHIAAHTSGVSSS